MSTGQPPSRTADQFVVRFPEGMRDRIAEEAKANNRSMNAEIVARLGQSLEYVPAQTKKLEDQVARLSAQLEGVLRTVDGLQVRANFLKRAGGKTQTPKE